MSDDDAVRALFHRIDEGPPLGIDPRDVMARGRRLRTMRTSLAIAGSAAVAAAAVVIGLSVGAEGPAPDMEHPARPPDVSSTSRPVPPSTTPDTEVLPAPPKGAGGGPGSGPVQSPPGATSTGPAAPISR